MRLDAEVARLKYDFEVQRLREQAEVLQRRGIFLLQSSQMPFVELFFTPRQQVQVLLPHSGPSTVGLPPNAMTATIIPSLAARAFIARFDLSDYDLLAPSLQFYDPWTRDLLPYETMFRAQEFEKQRGPHVVLLPDHPITHKPFLCVRGVREYHSHPQHSGDDWFLYRGSIRLFATVMTLWRVAIDLVRPQLILLRSGPGQPQLVVNWAAEIKD
jgi:hypothetical protein